MMDRVLERLRLRATDVGGRVAALVGLRGEEREQLELLLELLGWQVCGAIDGAAVWAAGTGPKAGARTGGGTTGSRDRAALIFVDEGAAAGFTDCSEMVVVVGGSRVAAEGWVKAKSMIWLARPLDIRIAERVIEAACYI